MTGSHPRKPQLRVSYRAGGHGRTAWDPGLSLRFRFPGWSTMAPFALPILLQVEVAYREKPFLGDEWKEWKMSERAKMSRDEQR